MKNFIKGLYEKPQFWKRFVWCFLAVTIMGFCVSWLNLVSLGNDPCSSMNLGISATIGMSFGNWQAILNTIVFIFVFVVSREQIGFGTVLNMFVVGYACDFMTFLRTKIWPDLVIDSLCVRIIVMLVAMIIFVLAAAVYMSVDLGTSPYDATSFIISSKLPRVSFRLVRIVYDAVVTLIAFYFHATIGIVTIIMVFAIGPCVQFMQTYIQRFFKEKE